MGADVRGASWRARDIMDYSEPDGPLRLLAALRRFSTGIALRLVLTQRGGLFGAGYVR